jgi:agmatine deiminase
MDGLEAVLAAPLKASVIPSSLFLENATFEVNGRGVLLISESLALERNPGMTREQIEVQLQAIPGVKKVIWLAEGVAEDPLGISTIEGNYVGIGAGGHTDEFVRFVDASTIFLAWEEAPGPQAHPVQRINHERMTRNYNILAHATDQDGKPFRVVKVPQPAVVQQPLKLLGKDDHATMWHNTAFPASEGRKEGDAVIQVASATYLNFLIANDVVLVPSYVQDGTDPAVEKRVAQLFQDAPPGRTIKFIRCTPLNYHGGGIHCATLSEPKR